MRGDDAGDNGCGGRKEDEKPVDDGRRLFIPVSLGNRLLAQQYERRVDHRMSAADEGRQVTCYLNPPSSVTSRQASPRSTGLAVPV